MEKIKTENIIVENQATDYVFFNYRHRPPKVKFCSQNPSKVQESPLDAKSPQELMDMHNMYVDRPSLKELKPFYADLSSFSSYEESLNKVRLMKEKFNSLDINIRARFNHNPEEFCEYICSKDFDIKQVMTPEMYSEYKRELDGIESRKHMDKYLNSKEYLDKKKDDELRSQFEDEMFENWKKQFKTT